MVWLQDAVEVCKAFMERDPQEVRFTIIALSKDSFEWKLDKISEDKEVMTAKHSKVLRDLIKKCCLFP